MSAVEEQLKRFLAYQETYRSEPSLSSKKEASPNNNSSANKTLSSRRTKFGDKAHDPDYLKRVTRNKKQPDQE